MADEIPNRSKVEGLQKIVQSKLKHGLPVPVQEELAHWLKLLPELNAKASLITIKSAELTIESLLSDSPNVLLSQDFREGIAIDMESERKGSRWGRFHNFCLNNLRGSTAPVRVFKGLVCFIGSFILLALLGLGFCWIALPQTNLWKLDYWSVLPIASFGGLGGIISIMVRLHDFIPYQRTDPAILFLNGLCKPIVGMSMALIVYFAVDSGLVTLANEPINPAKLPHFFYALAFLSGLSERFMRDSISQIKAGGISDRN